MRRLGKAIIDKSCYQIAEFNTDRYFLILSELVDKSVRKQNKLLWHIGFVDEICITSKIDDNGVIDRKQDDIHINLKGFS